MLFPLLLISIVVALKGLRVAQEYGRARAAAGSP